MKSPAFSVVIPLYNDKSRILALLGSLGDQSCRDFEAILVDDNSTDGSFELAKNYKAGYGLKIFRTKKNSGPAIARNQGIKNAKGKIILFTDSDCILPPDWIQSYSKLLDSHKDVLTGRVEMLPSNILGDSMSALGFPAGGSLGFDKMWKVGQDGSTVQIVTCNCAVRKKVFDEIGLFDETFPLPFGEDTEMSQRMLKRGYKIYYTPLVYIKHPPRSDLKSFARWSFRRGRGVYHLKRKVPLEGFVKLRFWSMKNVLSNAFKTYKAPVIIILFLMYNIIQQSGYVTEMLSPTKK